MICTTVDWLKEIVMYGIGMTDKSSLFHRPLLEILLLLLSQLLFLLKLQNLIDGNLSKWSVFLFLCILDNVSQHQWTLLSSPTTQLQYGIFRWLSNWHFGDMVQQLEPDTQTQYRISRVSLAPSVSRSETEHLRWYYMCTCTKKLNTTPFRQEDERTRGRGFQSHVDASGRGRGTWFSCGHHKWMTPLWLDIYKSNNPSNTFKF